VLRALRVGGYLFTAPLRSASFAGDLLSDAVGRGAARARLVRAWYFLHRGTLWRVARHRDGRRDVGGAEDPAAALDAALGSVRCCEEALPLDAELGEGCYAHPVASLLLCAVQVSDTSWFEIVHPTDASGGQRFFAYDVETAQRWVRDVRDCTASLLRALASTPIGTPQRKTPAESTRAPAAPRPRGGGALFPGEVGAAHLSSLGPGEAAVVESAAAVARAHASLLALPSNDECADCAAPCECSFMYRYIVRESCSQFDSLPLTSLTYRRPALARCQLRSRRVPPLRQRAPFSWRAGE
jgi:hypothetical protein